MNDVGYDTSITFKDSHLYTEILYRCRLENLKNLKRACEGAVAFHTKENNASQIKYFSEALELINKKLRIKE